MFHACSCGAHYTHEEWAALHCPGLMAFESGLTFDLRDCRACRSTMGIVLLPVPAHIAEWLESVSEKDAA